MDDEQERESRRPDRKHPWELALLGCAVAALVIAGFQWAGAGGAAMEWLGLEPSPKPEVPLTADEVQRQMDERGTYGGLLGLHGGIAVLLLMMIALAAMIFSAGRAASRGDVTYDEDDDQPPTPE